MRRRAENGTGFSQGVTACTEAYAVGKMPDTEVAPLPPAAANEGPVAMTERPRNQTDVYAVHGADPEVLA